MDIANAITGSELKLLTHSALGLLTTYAIKALDPSRTPLVILFRHLRVPRPET